MHVARIFPLCKEFNSYAFIHGSCKYIYVFISIAISSTQPPGVVPGQKPIPDSIGKKPNVSRVVVSRIAEDGCCTKRAMCGELEFNVIIDCAIYSIVCVRGCEYICFFPGI